MANLKHSIRALFKQPLFATVVIITCALGIGANTAVFSVVNAVLLRPLPFQAPNRLVALFPYDQHVGADNALQEGASCFPDFFDWRAQNNVFERMAVYVNESVTFTDGKEAVQLQGAAVSAELFNLLGVQPRLGRTFTQKEDEAGSPQTVILSDNLWKRQFAADPAILGRTILLDKEQFVVIGVMPPGFNFPVRNTPIDLWITVAIFGRSNNGKTPVTEQRGNDFLGCIARLKPGVSLAQAQANMNTLSAALARQYPGTNTGVEVKVVPFLQSLIDTARSGLFMLCAMAGCVLLVACLNLANLLLARALSRRKEISIRSALGAGRWQIVKQLVTESLVLSVIGGVAGVVLGIWGLEALKHFLPASIPRIDQISLDVRVMIFAGMISLGVGLVSGILPAWRLSDPGIAASLNEATRGSTEGIRGRRTRAALVVLEIVFALVLLSSAGLLAKSFMRLQEVRPGFDPNNVATARIALPSSSYGTTDQCALFFKNLVARVSELPGVSAASAAWWLPLSGNESTLNVDIEERPLPTPEQPLAQMNVVTPDYFKTVGVPLLQGRGFTVQDDAKAPKVAVVSQEFVRQFFPGENPIGKRIKPAGSTEPVNPMREIVGVVGDMHLISLSAKPKPLIFVPHQQFAISGMSLLVRTQGNPGSMMQVLQRTVTELDKDVPLFRPRLLTEIASQSVSQPRFNAMLVGLFALIALVLAAAGIFGLTSYTVTQRTQEIGIRLALGAQRTDVLRLIIGQGMRLLGIGVLCGFLGVLGVAHLLQSLLFGIGAHDLTTMAGVAGILSLVALLACWIPARRASQVDPVVALRSE